MAGGPSLEPGALRFGAVALAVLASACKSESAQPVPDSASVEESEAKVPAATAAVAAGADSAPEGGTFRRQTDGAEMVFVPAGPFLRGSRAGEGQDDERPQRRIELSAFWIDRTEVTAGRYASCVSAGKCEPAKAEPWCTFGRPEKLDHPINCVGWKDADAYCGWAHARLPTEAEWEKAARGTDGDPYPWGPTKPTCVVAVRYDEELAHACGQYGTWAVGSKPFGRSPFGALDMAGNVWEWVSDWYDPQYYARAPVRDPKGPEGGKLRMMRGGGWGNDGAGALRSARRFRFAPEHRTPGTGFRCAKTGW